MLNAAFPEAVDNVGTDHDVLDGLVDLFPEILRKEIVGLKRV